MAKKRWVPKGTKSSGWKKTGQKRFVKKKKETRMTNRQYRAGSSWIAIMHPPKGMRRCYPDQYYTTIVAENMFTIPLLNNNFGNANGNYFNVCFNSAYRWMLGANVNNANALSITAGAGGAGATQGYGASSTSGFSINNDMPNVGTFANLYNNYLIYKQNIEVTHEVESINDTMEVAITPWNNGTSLPTTNGMLNILESGKCRNKQIRAYNSTERSNRISHSAHIGDFIGRPKVTVDEILSSTTTGTTQLSTFSGLTALTGAPTTVLGWLIYAKQNDGLAFGGQQIAVKIKVKSKILFYNPKPIANT